MEKMKTLPKKANNLLMASERQKEEINNDYTYKHETDC